MSALTYDEAQALADKCEIWPAGLGYVLEEAPDTKRGWQRAKNLTNGKSWHPFYYPAPPGLR